MSRIHPFRLFVATCPCRATIDAHSLYKEGGMPSPNATNTLGLVGFKRENRKGIEKKNRKKC